MSIIGSNILAGSSGQGGAYEIEQSLRFDGSSYLSRTPSTAGNRNTWTSSYWIKKAPAETASAMHTWSSTQFSAASFNGGSTSTLTGGTNSATVFTTTAKYRDPSAWMHIVVRYDTTQTGGNKYRIYINGEEYTGPWLTDARSSLGTGSTNNTVLHYIGNSAIHGGTTFAFQGYMAEFHHIDGTSLEPTNFGEYDDNGVWRPIRYNGTYSGNSFYLKFDASDVDGDSSGLGNDWTANNFTTSGAGTDVMSDTPTTSWCTLNPLHTESSFTYSNGNLEVQQSTGSGSGATSGGTIAVSSGKWFCEMSAIDKNAVNALIGVCTVDGFDGNRQLNESLTGGSGYGYVTNGNTATGSAYGSTWDLYDNMGIALDLDSAQNTVTFYKNGVSQGARNINNAAYVFACSNGQGSSYVTYRTNFGQRDFLMTPGTTSGTDYFNTVTYSGNGSTQSITGVGFQPDLVWIKSSTNSTDHYIADSIRGAYAFLISNNTGSQNSTTNYDPMSSFDSDGFTVRYTTTGGSTQNYTNGSGRGYIAWCWKAGGTASSNTDGTITSTVSASTAGAFSVCTYTGNTTSGATFGHGLDDAPGFVIVKNRDSGAQPWRIFHSSLGNTKAFKFDSNSADTDSAFWNNTSPSSTVVTLGNDNSTNATGDAYVAYCWAEKAGVTKIGTYTGNETLGDGPEVVCGFRPACVVMKADAGAAWEIHDFKRDANSYLSWSSSSTPTARQANKVLLTDNGFIIMGNDGNINLNGATIYFIAFAAEHTTDDTYKALNTANLPAPDIADGSEYFNTVLYTGNGTSQTISGLGFSPDLIWFKSRNASRSHGLFDSVRGRSKSLFSDLTIAELTSTSTQDLVSFDANGFTVGTVSNSGSTNTNNNSIVAWNWKAGGSGSSNTDGSITSTVSANPTAGFSIVSYTGNGNASATIGHGLGVKPQMVIVKSRSNSSTYWTTYHESISAGTTYCLELNTTAYKDQVNDSFFGSTQTFNSSVFSVGYPGAASNSTNVNNYTYIAYCFAEVEGYSKIGSYTGNESTDGPFIHTGFKVGWWLVKKATDATEYWYIRDTARDDENPISIALNPNSSDVEDSYGSFDFLSNGVKIRESGTGSNTSGSTYIYMALAEHPFGGDGVSPATAR